MDNRSPRSKEILGPRPTPLKIRKDSHKITKKPPFPQQFNQQEPLQQPPPQQRGPVIIYTVSPKIIHTDPNDFMTLVQSLTGKTSTSTTLSSSSPSTLVPKDTSAAISPAARFAATEKANNNSSELGFVGGVETMDQYHHHRVNERPNCYHGGILYPGPTSLPLISPEFFAPVGQTDPQGLSSFFNDFSSILQSSPSKTASPSSADLFNNFFDS